MEPEEILEKEEARKRLTWSQDGHGFAWAEGGDWRLADTDISRLRTLNPEAVQAAAGTPVDMADGEDRR